MPQRRRHPKSDLHRRTVGVRLDVRTIAVLQRAAWHDRTTMSTIARRVLDAFADQMRPHVETSR